MKLDCHTHSKRFSACSIISPDELLNIAREKGLDGLVFTEHEQFWPPEDIRWLRKAFPTLKIFNGVEISVGSLQHVVVIPPFVRKEILNLNTPAELEKYLDKNGGFAFAAHPYRWGYDFGDKNIDYSLPAVEVASSNMNEPELVQKSLNFARKSDARPVASSDAHSADPVGRYYIETVKLPHKQKRLVECLCAGEFTAVAPELDL